MVPNSTDMLSNDASVHNDTVVSETGLPDFLDPPVVETVLGVSFLAVPELTPIQIARFWDRHLSNELPKSEERPPYEVPVERFPPLLPRNEFSVNVSVGPPPLRFVFSSDNHLVQVQSDWLACNWRKTPERPDYERYEAGRERFSGYLSRFCSFIDEQFSAALQPTQCEVTYVNHVAASDLGPDTGPLGNLLIGVQPKEGEYLPRPQFADYSCQYDLYSDEVIGRLHVSSRPTQNIESGDEYIELTLVARGAPTSRDIPGVFQFLDQGREWIVRGFKDMTTPQMHERWGYRNEGTPL